jgi:hypothetical protein
MSVGKEEEWNNYKMEVVIRKDKKIIIKIVNRKMN